MDAFLRFVIGALVEFPEEVVITQTDSGDRTTFYLVARKTDLPKIIGKGGHTIQAIRSLLAAAGEKHGVKASLEIIE